MSVVTLKVKEELKISSLKKGEVHNLQLSVSDNSLGVPWKIPVIVIRGMNKGPTLGITAALHGNELNGISTIFKLVKAVDPTKLSGNLIMVPISNVPGYLLNQRAFNDGADLNRIMPGKEKGTGSAMYAHQFINKIVSKFDYLLDLHTASSGRVNSLYIRADLESEETRNLAYLQNPQIIVQKYDDPGTLRSWANENKIPAITIEIGNPDAFQHTLIDETMEGIINTMTYLKMLEGEVKDMVTDDAVICDHSYWIYSCRGGIIDVFPALADTVDEGDVIAKVYDVYGKVKETIKADKPGVVIGKNIAPHCPAGSRVLHLGVRMMSPMPEDVPGFDCK